jgi:hypothetical protein
MKNIKSFENFLNEDLNNEEKTEYTIEMTDHFISKMSDTGKFEPKGNQNKFTVKLFKNDKGNFQSRMLKIGSITYDKKDKFYIPMDELGFTLYAFPSEKGGVEGEKLKYYINYYKLFQNAGAQGIKEITNKNGSNWGGEFDLENDGKKELDRRQGYSFYGDFKSDEVGTIDYREFFKIIK